MSEPASSDTNTNENPQSSQAIVDGLREGSLVTESIQKQQEEIMKKMEETIRAAQIKIKKENAQIKQIITKVQGVTVSLRRMVEESNRILEGNRRLLQKAIQVTEKDIRENKDREYDIRLQSLLKSLKEYNENKITKINQVGNVYMSFMKDVYTLAGIFNPNLNIPDRSTDAFSTKTEEDAGFLANIGSKIGEWFGFGGSMNIKKMRETIGAIHQKVLERKEMIKNIMSAIKKISENIIAIVYDIEKIRRSERDDVIEYLDEFPDTEGYPEKKLKELYSIPMRSISQINKNFEVLAKGMLTVATVEGYYETPPADLDTAPVPQIQQQKEPETQYSTTPSADRDERDLEESQAPSFWSSIFGTEASAPSTSSSSSPFNVSVKQDPDTESDEETEECENIDDSVNEILTETAKIQVPTNTGNLSDTTCNDYKDYVKKIQDIKGNITYNSCKPLLKSKLTRRQNLISGIIASHCDNTTRRSSRFRGGGSHTHNQSFNKTLKNRRWYMKKAKKHVKGKRKYPSRL